jgi:hypothetical protein
MQLALIDRTELHIQKTHAYHRTSMISVCCTVKASRMSKIHIVTMLMNLDSSIAVVSTLIVLMVASHIWNDGVESVN